MKQLILKLKIYILYYLEYLENTTLFTIIKSRFIKPKKDNEIERKRAICSGCKYNSNNSSKKFSYKIFLTSLSDFYSLITGNRKVDNLGNCLACSACSVYYKSIYETKCPAPEGDKWRNKQTILKFELDGCKPCIGLTRQLETLDLTNFIVENIDLNKDKDSAKKYNIKSVPTLVILDNKDQELERFSGFVELKTYIEKQ